jgi:plastocyanin
LNTPLAVLKSLLSLVFLWICCSACSSEPEKSTPELHRIVISSMKFNPAELTIRKGDTVEFVNQDLVVHDITQLPDKTWSSSNLSPGQTYKITLRMNTLYYCSIHPVMKGSIIVQ